MDQFKIKLLPPDISPAVLADFSEGLSGRALHPDRQLHEFQTALQPLFPDHALLGVSSGTAALHLALRLLGVGAGDYVLCPSFTFAATVNAILYQQAIPVLIDSEAQSWNMDPLLVQQAMEDLIRQGHKPAALVVVHAYGTPACMEELMAVAAHYEVPVLEDAAPALGACYRGQACGTFGRLGAISFNYNKVITTGGGGLLLSKEQNLIREADYLASQARAQAPYYLHETAGYNYRMSGLVAGLGAAQLKFLDHKLARKKAIFSAYYEELHGRAGIDFQQFPEEISPNYWLSSFLWNTEADKLLAYEQLHAQGIECRMLWRPLQLQPAYSKFPAYLNGVSEMLFQRGLSVPSAVSLREEEQAEVIQALKSVCRK